MNNMHITDEEAGSHKLVGPEGHMGSSAQSLKMIFVSVWPFTEVFVS